MHSIAARLLHGAAHGAALAARHSAQNPQRPLASNAFDDRIRSDSELGSHLVVTRLGYTHHGIYVGHCRVIHYSGAPKRKRHASVREDTLSDFAAGKTIWVLDYARCDPPDTVITRARSRLGERNYDLLHENCEHFSTWCKVGNGHSRQVRQVADSLKLGAHAPVAFLAMRLAERLQQVLGMHDKKH